MVQRAASVRRAADFNHGQLHHIRPETRSDYAAETMDIIAIIITDIIRHLGVFKCHLETFLFARY